MSGQTGLTPYDGADGNGDGMITRADYDHWKAHYGETAPGAGAVVELAAGASLIKADEVVERDGAPLGHSDRVDINRAVHIGSAAQRTLKSPRSLTPALSHRERESSIWKERESNHSRGLAGRDAALLAWFDSQIRISQPFEDDGIKAVANGDRAGVDERDAGCFAFDLAIESLWQTRFTPRTSLA
jgi:hypothetical protein